MIEPGDYNFTIHQGATFGLELQYKDGDSNPVNMTGFSVEAKLSNRLRSSAIATFQITFVDTALGKFKIGLTAAQTAAITEEGQYDVLITEPAGTKYYILQGRVFVDFGVTGVL